MHSYRIERVDAALFLVKDPQLPGFSSFAQHVDFQAESDSEAKERMKVILETESLSEFRLHQVRKVA